MFENFKDTNMVMPFFLAAGAAAPKMSFQRVIEAVIIAIITAAATSYITVQKLDFKQDQIQRQFEEQVKRRDAEVKGIKDDVSIQSARRDAQYEILRNELQKIALNMERMKPR